MNDITRPTTHTRQIWPKAGASIAVFASDTILLVQRAKSPAKGKWSLPGGHIEPGETAHDAALRELHEETGISAQIIGINTVVDAIAHAADGTLEAHYVISSFFGIWTAGDVQPSSDAADARWVPLHEVSILDLTPRAAESIKSAHEKLTIWLASSNRS